MKPNDLGKNLIVEQCQKITISEFIRRYKEGLKMNILSSAIEVSNQKLELTTSKTGFNGIRYWFNCPSCHRRVGVLLIHPISQILGCRICLGLEYRKRRYKGMVENSGN